MKRSSASTSTRRLSSALRCSAPNGWRSVPGLDLLTQPHTLAVRGDVLDLIGDRPAVGLAQVRQCLGERLAGHVHAQNASRYLCHHLWRQPGCLRVELGLALGLGAEWVQARRKMSVAAEAVHQSARGLDRLQHLLVGHHGLRGGCRRRAGSGRHGGARRRAELDAERREHALVEVVLTLQASLHQCQEAARLRPLDHAVVVGRGHRHDLLRADLLAHPASPTG